MIPAENEIVWIQGYEFTASNVQVVANAMGQTVVRFTGRCTDNPVNDSIRHLAYNGGRYGWAVDPANLNRVF